MLIPATVDLPIADPLVQCIHSSPASTSTSRKRQGCGSGSRRAKMTQKERKNQKVKKFHVLTWCSLLRAEGFSCDLGVLYRGLGISKLQFLIQKIWKICFLCPFAIYYLRYAVMSFFTMSRISLVEGKTAGQKVHRKIAGAVQNVKPLYFLSRSFEIRIHF